MLLIFYALAIVIKALVFALMTVYIRKELRILSEIKAVKPGEEFPEADS